MAITNHLATVFWLLSGMASCFTSCLIRSERGSQRCFTDEIGLELFGLALRGEGDAPIAGPPCRFHHVYHGLMSGFGIGVNDDGGVGLIARSIFQGSCQRVYTGVR